MARLTDHDVRDAEHAIRAECSLLVGQYIRRIVEAAKADVQGELELAAKEGRDVNGIALGRAAFARAATNYFGALATSRVLTLVEGGSDHEDTTPLS